MFYLLLAILIGVIITLFLRNDAGSVLGLDLHEFAQLGFFGAILIFLGLGAFAGQRFSDVVRNAFAWLLIAVGTIGLYTYKEPLLQFAQDIRSELFPGQAVTTGDGGELAVIRDLSGHFEIDARVNGATVPMLVDTGASTVVLTIEDAAKIGYDERDLSFNRPVSTANGIAYVAPITLESIQIGNIRVDNVRAAIARDGALGQSLLGMTYLNRLSSFEFAGRRLILRP